MKSQAIIEKLRLFKQDSSGQFGVWTALLAVPILGLTTFLLDFRQSQAQQMEVASALDSAALAAVINQNITEEERATYAREYFWDQISKPDYITLDVEEASSNRVTLHALTQTPTSVAKAVGVLKIKSRDTSTAVLTQGDTVVCALALDPHGENAFTVTQGAKFFAPTCSVQVNSNHPKAATVGFGGKATAKDFCITGGASGNFAPHANTECGRVEDPYVGRNAPDTGPCVDEDEINAKLNHWHSTSKGITLQPGTYCGSFVLRSKVITFEPGVYTFKGGPLIFTGGSKINGDGVSFVLEGDNAYIQSINGSKVDLKAPASGPLAGLAIFQKNKGVALPDASRLTSTFQSGGELNIVGTVYLPDQKIKFINGGKLSSQAPATSFIGHSLFLSTGAKLNVKVDHRAAGLPPLLPRSDEGARLVR